MSVTQKKGTTCWTLGAGAGLGLDMGHRMAQVGMRSKRGDVILKGFHVGG
jgi:hypothetical protein